MKHKRIPTRHVTARLSGHTLEYLDSLMQQTGWSAAACIRVALNFLRQAQETGHADSTAIHMTITNAITAKHLEAQAAVARKIANKAAAACEQPHPRTPATPLKH